MTAAGSWCTLHSVATESPRPQFAKKADTRAHVWKQLTAQNVARFPFPVQGRIPNFAGAREAAQRLFTIPAFRDARRLKINPDSPQRWVRAEALRRGITIYVPTPRLKGGFMRFDPATIDDERCRDVHDRMVDAGVDVGLWETTSDIGVACFHCVICDAGDAPGHIGIGDGCHTDRAIALLRALTEAAQTRLTYISGARDDLDPAEFTADALAAKRRYVRDLIDGSEATEKFPSCPTRSSDCFEDDLAWLLGRLASVGLDQVVTVDLSRAEFGIPVIRAIIPGLEAPHDDPDFVAGPRAHGAARGMTANAR